MPNVTHMTEAVNTTVAQHLIRHTAEHVNHDQHFCSSPVGVPPLNQITLAPPMYSNVRENMDIGAAVTRQLQTQMLATLAFV